MRPSLPVLAGIAALSLTLAGCSGTPAAPASGQKSGEAVAMATTTPLGSVLSDITSCAGTTSTTLMGPGDDPHTFAVSSEQVASIAKARVVFSNGLGLEEGIEDALNNAKTDGAKVVEIAPKVDPIPFGEEEGHDHEGEDAHEEEGHDHEGEDAHEEEGHDHEAEASASPSASTEAHDDHDHEASASPSASASTEAHDEHEEEGHHHEHGSQDPHFWLDASRMAKAAKVMGDELASSTGDKKYTECGAKVADELTKLDAELTQQFKALPQENRVLVTDHEAFGYFAKRYGFELAGVVIPGGSTDAEPSSADLAKVVAVVKEHKAKALFSNTAVNPKVVEAVAAEAGTDVKVVPLYVGSVGKPGTEAATYAGMMRENAKLITDALK